MKNLIYLPFALLTMLLAVSCTKDASVAPSSNVSIPTLSDTKPAPNQDTQAGTATVNLINTTGSAYQASFSGTSPYTVDMPANANQEILVKAGTYSIQVYPSDGHYAAHSFTWNNLLPVISARAYFSSVAIAANSHQELLIY